jgi:hypothetical protein
MRCSLEESVLTFENDRVARPPLKRSVSNSHRLGRPRRPHWGMFSKTSSFMIRISSSQNVGYSPQRKFNGSRVELWHEQPDQGPEEGCKRDTYKPL